VGTSNGALAKKKSEGEVFERKREENRYKGGKKEAEEPRGNSAGSIEEKELGAKFRSFLVEGGGGEEKMNFKGRKRAQKIKG